MHNSVQTIQTQLYYLLVLLYYETSLKLQFTQSITKETLQQILSYWSTV